MARYTSRSRVIPIIIIIIVAIIAVAAIVSLGRAIFSSNGENQASQAEQQLAARRDGLLNMSTNREVRMTIRGGIVADEQFASYRVTISPTTRSLVTYKGYLDQSVDIINLSNNAPAYDEFVHALDKANFAQGTPFAQDKDDTRGVCASGVLYEFETIDAGQVKTRLWTSSCKGSPGSLAASSDQLSSLFLAQIPDGRSVVRALQL